MSDEMNQEQHFQGFSEEVPDNSMVALEDNPNDPKKVTAQNMTSELPMAGGGLDGKSRNDPFSGLDMSALKDEPIEDVVSLDEKTLSTERFVLAKYLGAHNSPFTEHKQRINGREAVFPLDQWVIVPFYFIKESRRSGYADFVHQPGGRNMKFSPNHPSFQIQEIPDPYNTKERISEWQQLLKEKKDLYIPLACTSF